MLHLQRRAGSTADSVDQLRRKQCRAHPAGTAPRARHVDGFRRLLDRAERAVPPALHSHLYAPERRNPCHCACHHPALQRLVRAAAGQHLLDLLFPVHSPPEGFLHRLDCAGASRQRASHLRASRAFCARGNLVGNASDRACDERLRCLCHAEKSDRTLCKSATCVLRFLC